MLQTKSGFETLIKIQLSVCHSRCLKENYQSIVKMLCGGELPSGKKAGYQLQHRKKT